MAEYTFEDSLRLYDLQRFRLNLTTPAPPTGQKWACGRSRGPFPCRPIRLIRISLVPWRQHRYSCRPRNPVISIPSPCFPLRLSTEILDKSVDKSRQPPFSLGYDRAPNI